MATTTVRPGLAMASLRKGACLLVVLLLAVQARAASAAPFPYADNLAPGFADSLCSSHEGAYRGPYLQSTGARRTIVRWSSETAGLGVVCYGTSPGRMTAVALDTYHADPSAAQAWAEPQETHHHAIALENLSPSSKYYYVTAVISREDLQGGKATVFAASGDNTGRDGSASTSPAPAAGAAEEHAMRAFLFPEGGPGAPQPQDEGDEEDAAAAVANEALSIVSPAKYFSFRTFPEPGAALREPVRVWAVGDGGTGDYKAKAVRDAFANFTGGDWDLTLGLGDLAYYSGEDWEYQKKFFEIYKEENARVPVFTTPGNHDRPTSDLWKQTGPYFDVFTNPGDGKSGGVASNHPSYYSFDYGPIHFVSVDSNNLGLNDDPELYAWLEKDLAAAQKADYDWIVAYHHQPPYSKGSHDSDAQYECYKLRQNLVPMFEKYGVDLVLAGHSHSYERSHLLSGHFGSSYEAAGSDAAVVKGRWEEDPESGVATLVKRECGQGSGTVYIVAGSGGKTSGGALDHPAMHHSRNELGSLLLEFDGEDKSVGIYLVGSEVEPGKQVLNQAVLRKAGTCPQTSDQEEDDGEEDSGTFSWEARMEAEAYSYG
mmetsp:Transcript_9699/g.19397  ORF Transcript_9699/g.19397 Transcript_9699/m.19397 type:complete len:599 (-) Transcript_9699:59-1855(-)